MASKIELAALILGIDAAQATEGLNHAELTTLLGEVQAADGPVDDDTDTTATEVEAPKAPYTIAKGKAVTSLRGIIGEGEAVAAKDFVGGQDTLDRLVDKQYIDKAVVG